MRRLTTTVTFTILSGMLFLGVAPAAASAILPTGRLTPTGTPQTVSSSVVFSSPQIVPSKRNWKKLLLAPAVISQLVQAETPLNSTFPPQGNAGSAVASYETRSLGTQTIAIVSIEVFPSGDFRRAAQEFASSQSYTTLSLTKKRWSGYVERDGYVLYMYFNNIGRSIIAIGGVAVLLPIDDARRASALAQAKSIALSQGVKLNKAGWGTLGSTGR